jgi:hypothetical protein
VAAVPEITRMIARIEGWKEARGKARGRAETDRVLGEAHRLFDELSDLLPAMWRELLDGSRQQR